MSRAWAGLLGVHRASPEQASGRASCDLLLA